MREAILIVILQKIRFHFPEWTYQRPFQPNVVEFGSVGPEK
jgi:hypothetical protein